MARFYSLKKKDEDDAKTADPFGVLRPKVKNAEQQQVNIYDMAKAYVFLADGFEDIGTSRYPPPRRTQRKDS